MKKIPDKKYKYILENMPICCIDLIIYQNKKVLLIKRKENPAKNKWWFPGGRILKNETFNIAVIHKAKEETGLDVKIKKKVGFYEFFEDKGVFPDLKTGVHSISMVFIVEPIDSNQEIKLDKTSLEFKWIDNIEKDTDNYIKIILKHSKVFD